jgi:hypothetical protein
MLTHPARLTIGTYQEVPNGYVGFYAPAHYQAA